MKQFELGNGHTITVDTVTKGILELYEVTFYEDGKPLGDSKYMSSKTILDQYGVDIDFTEEKSQDELRRLIKARIEESQELYNKSFDIMDTDEEESNLLYKHAFDKAKLAAELLQTLTGIDYTTAKRMCWQKQKEVLNIIK